MSTRAFSVAYQNGEPLPIGIYALLEQPSGASKSRCLNIAQQPFFHALKQHRAVIDAEIDMLPSDDREGRKTLTLKRPPPLFQTNTTPEALEGLLLYTLGAFSLLSSEQGIIDTLLGLSYGDGRASNNDIVLNGFNGHHISSHRISREGYSGRVFGGITCFAQDGTIQKILTQSRETGLAERFLMMAEPHNIGRRDFTKYHEIDAFLLDWYSDCCGFIAEILKQPKELNELTCLNISKDAWYQINLARNDLEPLQLDGGKYSHSSLRGAASKIDMQIMKIAANLHLLSLRGVDGVNTTISDDLVMSAINIAKDLLESNYLTLQDKGIVGRKAEWQLIMDFLLKSKSGKFSEIRETLRHVKVFKTAQNPKEKIQTTLDEMVSASLLVVKAGGKYEIK